MKYALFFAMTLASAQPPKEAAYDFALGRWDALFARFGPQMKAAITVEKLRSLAQFGRCQPPTEPPATSKPRPDLDTSVYRIVCEKQTIGLSLTTSVDGLIQGLFLSILPNRPPAGTLSPAPTSYQRN